MIRQAVEDAVSHPDSSITALDRRQARSWLTKPNAWFAEVCGYLNLDPERARLKFKAYIQATDENGGITPHLVIEEIASHAPIASIDPSIMAKIQAMKPQKSNQIRRRAGRPGATISYRGRAQNIAVWADEFGLSLATVRDRLKRGLPLDQVFAPSIRGHAPSNFVEIDGQRLSLREVAERAGISVDTVRSRFARGITGSDLMAPAGPTRPGGGSKHPSIVRDRRGSLRARDAEIGVFQS